MCSITRTLLLMLFTLLVACTQAGGSPPGSQTAAHLPSPAFSHYIIVGDSLMDLSSDGELTTTPSLILLEEGKSVTNFSLAGQSMAGFLGKGGAQRDGVGGAINFLTVSEGSLLYGPPGAAVIIELAHNDWYASNPVDEFYASYVQFLEAIDRAKLVIVFCVAPIPAKWDYNGRRNANDATYEVFREAVRRVSETGLCNLVETSDWFTENDVFDPTIMTDGVHLTAGGHRRYKDRLIQAVDQY